MHAFSREGLGMQCKKVLEWILPIALDNYPEMMFRSHMINVPFGFKTFFNFVWLFLDPKYHYTSLVEMLSYLSHAMMVVGLEPS